MFAVVSGFVLHLLLTAALFPPSKGIGTWPFTNVHQSMPPPLSRVWRLMKARWTCLCELRQPLLSMPSRCPRLATASRVLSVRSVRQACGDSTEQEKKKRQRETCLTCPSIFQVQTPRVYLNFSVTSVLFLLERRLLWPWCPFSTGGTPKGSGEWRAALALL